MDINLNGIEFTNQIYNVADNSEFQLEHDYFGDLVIYTEINYSGTKLIQDTDYQLINYNEDLSNRSGKQVYNKVKITNPTYYNTNLYFSGYYIADANSVEDLYSINFITKTNHYNLSKLNFINIEDNFRFSNGILPSSNLGGYPNIEYPKLNNIYDNPNTILGKSSIAIFQDGLNNLLQDSDDLTTSNWHASNSDIIANYPVKMNFENSSFSKLMDHSTGKWSYYYQGVSLAKKEATLQAVIRKGNSPIAIIGLYDTNDNGDRAYIYVDFLNKNVYLRNYYLEYKGKNLLSYWYDDETVWISVSAVKVNLSNSHEVCVYPTLMTESTYYFTYFTNIKLTQSPFPTNLYYSDPKPLWYPFQYLNQFTFMSWVKLNSYTVYDISASNGPTIISCTELGGWNISFERRLSKGDYGNDLVFPINVDGTYHILSYPSSYLPLNEWFHLAATLEQGDSKIIAKLFINGDKVGQLEVAGNLPLKSPSLKGTYIGDEMGNLGNERFNGYLSEIAIGEIVLSEDEIKNYYNSHLPIKNNYITGKNNNFHFGKYSNLFRNII